MKMSQNITNIAKALLGVQKEMKAVKKGNKNPFFKSNYADINDFLSELKPLLSANGVLLLQPATEQTVETVLIHAESGEFISGETPIKVVKDNDPQALGSAITYSRRYGVQSLLALEAEDDDGNAGAGKTKPQVTVQRTPEVTLPSGTNQAENTPVNKGSSFKVFKKAAVVDDSTIEF